MNLILFSYAIGIIPAYSISQFKEGPLVNDSKLKVELVYTGEIKFPSSMAFLGTNDILILEKNEGNVKRVVNGTILPEPLLNINISNHDERGLLGIAVSPHFFKNEKEGIKTNGNVSANVFLYYTKSLNNLLYRYELADNKLINPKLVLSIPNGGITIHNGGKIIIGPDKNLYLPIGNLRPDYSKPFSKAENLKNGTNPDGSGGILRISQNGQVAGHGIIGKTYPLNLYYGYGIRNSFGIAFDPVSGKLWDTENGGSFGDEINLVEPGFNSGWFKVQGIWEYPYGKSYSSIGPVATNPAKDLVDFNGTGKYSSPELTLNRTVGLTDITFLNSDKLGKNYENDMFVGDFNNGYLYHFDLNNNRTELSLKAPLNDRVANNNDELKDVIFAKGFGAITDIEVGPDGYLYVLSLHSSGSECDAVKGTDEKCISFSTGNPGSIFRIVPAKSG